MSPPVPVENEPAPPSTAESAPAEPTAPEPPEPAGGPPEPVVEEVPAAGVDGSRSTEPPAPLPPPTVAVEPELEIAGTAPSVPEPSLEPALPAAVVPEVLPAPPLPSEPIPPPPPPVVAPTIVPPRAGVEIIVAPSYLPALQEFLDTTSAGHRGVAIVRESPERLRTHVGPRPVEVYWLTNLGRGLTLKPSDLDAYSAFLETALRQDRVTAFFLEGIEYLARLHGMDRIVERLSLLHAQAVEHDARVWVCVHPGLLAPADLERLVAAFGK
ncbi:MAG: DUF835 domain-containing protein [Thermoplasmata archaeon]